jgi:hypothetical protein
MRGGSRGGGFGGRGGYARGGYAPGGRKFSHEDLYQDYPGPDQQTGAGGYAPGYETGYPGPGAAGFGGGGYGVGAYDVEPSRQIMVRNVSRPVLASLINYI